MRLDSVLAVIDKAMDEIIETEIKNIFGNMGPDSHQRDQLATGFERVNLFEAMAIEEAKKKFKP